MGIVAQDDALFAGNLADNIAFFDPEPDMARICEVAGLAGIAADIARMPMQYDTLVGDMGSTLSDGQKQRVLLARALYANPLVLFSDEGTAHLDPASEALVTGALAVLPLTRIHVAHRAGATHGADRILIIANGQAVDQAELERAFAAHAAALAPAAPFSQPPHSQPPDTNPGEPRPAGPNPGST